MFEVPYPRERSSVLNCCVLFPMFIDVGGILSWGCGKLLCCVPSHERNVQNLPVSNYWSWQKYMTLFSMGSISLSFCIYKSYYHACYEYEIITELIMQQETQTHKEYVNCTMNLPSVFILNRFEKKICMWLFKMSFQPGISAFLSWLWGL